MDEMPINKDNRLNKYYEKLNPYYQPSSQSEMSTDDTLLFESRFESGNLRRAMQVDRYEYDLILKTDYGTNNYT